MLEALGLRRGAGARAGRPDPLQHLLDPRGGRQPARRAPRRGHAASSARTRRRVIGVGGCWAQSLKDEVFERFPFVDVAFGPGQVHRLAEFLTSDSLSAQGYFEFEGFTGELPAQARRARTRAGSRSASAATASARTASCRRRADARSAGRSGDLVDAGPRAGRRRRARDHAARPERQLLRARPAAAARAASPSCCAQLDPIPGLDRIRYTSPHPKDMREDVIRAHAELRVAVRAHPPAAAVGLVADPARDAADLRPRALPRPRRADPRARARRRADDRHHRRLPGRDRGRLRADAVAGRAGRLRRRVHVRRSRRGAGPRRRRSPRGSCPTRRRSRGSSGSSRSSSAARASARSGSSGARSRCSSRARAAPTPTRLRGRTRHNKVVNFAGLAAPGELALVEVDGGDEPDAVGRGVAARARGRLTARRGGGRAHAPVRGTGTCAGPRVGTCADPNASGVILAEVLLEAPDLRGVSRHSPPWPGASPGKSSRAAVRTRCAPALCESGASSPQSSAQARRAPAAARRALGAAEPSAGSGRAAGSRSGGATRRDGRSGIACPGCPERTACARARRRPAVAGRRAGEPIV